MDEQWRRLQAMYAGMGDDELLELARAKAELTEVAQRVVDAEMSRRGLELPAEEPEPPGEMPAFAQAKDDPSLIELMTFQIPADAEKALRELDEHGIPLRMEQAMRRFTADGPLVRTNWLTIFVQAEHRQDAVAVLRKRMGLFPELAPEEASGPDDPGDEEDSLAIVGSFDEDADVEIAQQALTGAGVWFSARKDTEDGPGFGVTTIEVRTEDGERALEVVEAAFSELE